MAGLKPETLSWVDQLETIRALGSTASRADRKKALNLSDGLVTNITNLEACFDSAAIEKVRQAAQANPPFILSSNSAKTLIGLKKRKVADLHGSVHAALDIILARQLTPKQIEALVDWVASGKPASEFDPKYKPKPVPVEMTDVLPEDEDEPEEKPVKAKNQSSSKSKRSKASSDDPSWGETLLLDWLADISVIAQIKSKAKKGKPVSPGEWGLLGLHKLFEIIGHLIKFGIKLIKGLLKLAKLIWKLIVEILKEVGLYKYAKALFVFAALFIACWFVWETFNYGFMRPVEFIWSKIHLARTVASEPTPVPTPQPQVSTPMPPADGTMVHLKPKPTAIPTYRPSIAFKMTDFDPKLLEQEIAAIPANSVIKNYVFQPDEGMPADLAVSRLQDLTDADKYTMMIGSGKQKILSVTPSNTNFIITYKSTDPLGLFGNSSGTMNIFLEDIQYIHINEIDCSSPRSGTQQPNIIYQCSLVVSGAKNPLTIQCASAEDLGHLVSTLEYFIRQSRLGHDAQPGGMPYPSQGVKLNNNHVVTLLWAKSPMDLAGVGLGDHFWSVGKITSVQQSLKDLEEGIQTLPATFFVVSPAEWEKAQTAAQKPGSDSSIHPKLRKVYLGH